MSVSNVALYAGDDEDGTAVWSSVSGDGKVWDGFLEQAKGGADLVRGHPDGISLVQSERIQAIDELTCLDFGPGLLVVLGV
jgi:hypothetical protein